MRGPLRSMNKAIALLILVARVGFGLQPRQPAVAVSQATRTTVIDRIVRDLCGKRVAFLGESPTHGFGEVLAFKTELARRLVDECHFNAFFIESGAYDF